MCKKRINIKQSVVVRTKQSAETFIKAVGLTFFLELTVKLKKYEPEINNDLLVFSKETERRSSKKDIQG